MYKLRAFAAGSVLMVCASVEAATYTMSTTQIQDSCDMVMISQDSTTKNFSAFLYTTMGRRTLTSYGDTHFLFRVKMNEFIPSFEYIDSMAVSLRIQAVGMDSTTTPHAKDSLFCRANRLLVSWDTGNVTWVKRTAADNWSGGAGPSGTDITSPPQQGFDGDNAADTSDIWYSGYTLEGTPIYHKTYSAHTESELGASSRATFWISPLTAREWNRNITNNGVYWNVYRVSDNAVVIPNDYLSFHNENATGTLSDPQITIYTSGLEELSGPNGGAFLHGPKEMELH